MKASLTKAEMMEMGRKWQTAWCLPGALRETRRDADTALGSAVSLSLSIIPPETSLSCLFLNVKERSCV